MTTTLNGKARKSLADQIDRLDLLIDGLAEGLTEAVAAAVQQAVMHAVIEVLTNPEVRARLQEAAMPAAAKVEPTPPAAPPASEPRASECAQPVKRPTWASKVAQRMGVACGNMTQSLGHIPDHLGRLAIRVQARIQEGLTTLGRSGRRFGQRAWMAVGLVRCLFQPTTTAFLAGLACGAVIVSVKPLGALALMVLLRCLHA
jgi:hypothetical protein